MSSIEFQFKGLVEQGWLDLEWIVQKIGSGVGSIWTLLVLTSGCTLSEVMVFNGMYWRGASSKGLNFESSKLEPEDDVDVGLEEKIAWNWGLEVSLGSYSNYGSIKFRGDGFSYTRTMASLCCS